MNVQRKTGMGKQASGGDREIYGQRGRLHERLHEENGLTGRETGFDRLPARGSAQLRFFKTTSMRGPLV